VFYVRCRHHACRHRRKSRTHPDDYKRVPACEVCGERKGWRIERPSVERRAICHCEGPVGKRGPFPHKVDHPLCDQHPEGPRNQLLRAGYTELDIFEFLPLDRLGRKVKNESDEFCPF
jgi:hypothetical protein